MTMRQVSPHSFWADANTIDALRQRVLAAGWQAQAPRGAYETDRLVSDAGGILIFYTTGSINVQGKDARRVIKALRRFGGLDGEAA